MSLEAWGDENPDDADYETWADRAVEAGWEDLNDHSPGAVAILRERERQETEEKWTPAHDDKHIRGEMRIVAALYALPVRFRFDIRKAIWPPSWGEIWWKPKTDREDLVRAGALIAAEIDRLDRLEKPSS